MSSENTQNVSLSVEIRPFDRRCRYWAKIVRPGQALPRPSEVKGANDIPGGYLRLGDEELFPGEILFEGEAMHHRKQRGWTYSLTWCDHSTGEKRTLDNPDAKTKADLKSAGLPAELLRGAGGPAACVRVAHALRLGLYRPETFLAEQAQDAAPSQQTQAV